MSTTLDIACVQGKGRLASASILGGGLSLMRACLMYEGIPHETSRAKRVYIYIYMYIYIYIYGWWGAHKGIVANVPSGSQAFLLCPLLRLQFPSHGQAMQIAKGGIQRRHIPHGHGHYACFVSSQPQASLHSGLAASQHCSQDHRRHCGCSQV